MLFAVTLHSLLCLHPWSLVVGRVCLCSVHSGLLSEKFWRGNLSSSTSPVHPRKKGLILCTRQQTNIHHTHEKCVVVVCDLRTRLSPHAHRWNSDYRTGGEGSEEGGDQEGWKKWIAKSAPKKQLFSHGGKRKANLHQQNISRRDTTHMYLSPKKRATFHASLSCMKKFIETIKTWITKRTAASLSLTAHAREY